MEQNNNKAQKKKKGANKRKRDDLEETQDQTEVVHVTKKEKIQGKPNTKVELTEIEEGVENLVFEDPFEDEYDQEDEIQEEELENKEAEKEREKQILENILQGKPEQDEIQPKVERKVFIPGKNQNEQEKLEYESRAYDMIHFMQVDWPCLSFDFLTDSLGFLRTKYPHTVYVVAGSQAGKRQRNKLLVMKMHSLHKTKHDDDESSSDSESGSESDDAAETDDDPILEYNSINIQVATNRIRSMPQRPGIVCVQVDRKPFTRIWDLTRHIQALDAPPPKPLGVKLDPLLEYGGHPNEGFAIDWSPTEPGRLLTGDCQKYIYLWNHKGGNWSIDNVPFSAHKASVEDLQWSSKDPNTFASCSVDKTVKVWDVRSPHNNSAASVVAHSSDVNVISWNQQVEFLLVSGSDDGTFKVWDTRKLTEEKMNFSWHRGPITSIEWNPNEHSVLAASSEDDTVSIWDLSLERDPSETTDIDNEIPAQLLFIHQGQKSIKEIHWHKQITNTLGSTAIEGFNIFKPSNLGK
eukprot:TRINITY_DN767_c0_g1_i2.p1 TRINITY_DN767_c0_g1~~TRINITY_DN767_c0_g1_i2.p1  ORF type:complete len:521 (+),score=124.79 TRINITY_DN767_c0_g1_i2:106-1668(+)